MIEPFNKHQLEVILTILICALGAVITFFLFYLVYLLCCLRKRSRSIGKISQPLLVFQNLILEIFNRNVDTSIEVDTLPGTSIFRRTGFLAPASSDGHLLFEVRLSHLDDVFAHFQNYRERISRDILRTANIRSGRIFAYVLRIAEARFQQVKQKWEDFKTILNPPRDTKNVNPTSFFNQLQKRFGHNLVLNRNKRVVPLIIVGILGGLLIIATTLSIYNAVELSKLKAADDELDEFIIKHLQEATNSVNRLSFDVEYLNDTNHFLDTSIQEGLSDFERSLMYSDVFNNFIQFVESIVNDKIFGITCLFNRQLTPQLVNSSIANSALNDLRGRAKAQGLLLPLESSTYLYQLPTDFLIGENNTLFIYSHIPLLSRNTFLTLYRYVGLPVKLPDSIHSVMIDTSFDYIAVDEEFSKYVLLTETELNQCDKIGYQLHNCRHITSALKQFDDNCLSALFTSRTDAINKICQFKVLHPRVQIEQVSPSEYYVFHPSSMQITGLCNNARVPKVIGTFSGLLQIQMSSSCRAQTSDYVLTAPVVLQTHFSVDITTTNYSINSIFLNATDFQVPELTSLLPAYPTHDIPVKDLLTEYMALKRSRVGHLDFPNFGLSLFGINFSISTISMAIGVGLLIYLFCKPNSPQREFAKQAVNSVATSLRSSMHSLYQQAQDFKDHYMHKLRDPETGRPRTPSFVNGILRRPPSLSRLRSLSHSSIDKLKKFSSSRTRPSRSGTTQTPIVRYSRVYPQVPDEDATVLTTTQTPSRKRHNSS